MNNSDITGLKLFNEKLLLLNKLDLTKYINENCISVEIKIKEFMDPTVESNLPLSKTIIEFLTVFRFFMLDKEKSSLRNLAKIYDHGSIPAKIKEDYKKLQMQFNQLLNYETVVVLQDKVLKNSDLLDIVTYGDTLHKNPDKSKLYDMINSSKISYDWIMAQLYEFFRHAISILIRISWLNHKTLELLETNA